MGNAEIRSRLEDAINNGEVLLVKYEGGSKPGATRQLSPIQFVGNDKVRAHCHVSGRNKVFLLSKIEIIDGGARDAGNYKSTPVPPEPRSLAEALDSHLDQLRALGWHVETSEAQYSIHRYFKNGKPRSTSVARIQFREFTYSAPPAVSVTLTLTADSEGVRGEISGFHDAMSNDLEDEYFAGEERLSERPWYVGCEERNITSTFKSLRKAAERFLDLATKLDPQLS